MGICRNAFGKLSYTATNSRKSVFSVTRRSDNGKVEIIHHMPYYNTDTYIDTGIPPFGDKVEPFDSFIQAARFLKENLERLV